MRGRFRIGRLFLVHPVGGADSVGSSATFASSCRPGPLRLAAKLRSMNPLYDFRRVVAPSGWRL